MSNKFTMVIPLIFVAILHTGCIATKGGGGRRLPTDAEVEQYNASVPPEERIVCRSETQVSSNIPRRVCRRVVDMEETSRFHREELRRVLQ